MQIKQTAVDVDDSLASIALIQVESVSVLGLEIKNTGSAPLTALQITGEVVNQGGTKFLLSSIAGDYSTPNYPVVRTIGAPVTLAAGASCLIVLDVSAFVWLTINAQCGTSTTVNVLGHLS
jgi:hypothetical protein